MDTLGFKNAMLQMLFVGALIAATSCSAQLKVDPHANMGKREGTLISIKGKQFVVRSDSTNLELESIRGIETTVTLPDGTFIYSNFKSSTKIDGDIFDSLIREITLTNEGRDIGSGDVFPTYTYTLKVDWKRKISLPECIWTDQSDFGPMRTVLKAPGYNSVICTWENLNQKNEVKSVKKFLKEDL